MFRNPDLDPMPYIPLTPNPEHVTKLTPTYLLKDTEHLRSVSTYAVNTLHLKPQTNPYIHKHA